MHVCMHVYSCKYVKKNTKITQSHIRGAASQTWNKYTSACIYACMYTYPIRQKAHEKIKFIIITPWVVSQTKIYII